MANIAKSYNDIHKKRRVREHTTMTDEGIVKSYTEEEALKVYDEQSAAYDARMIKYKIAYEAKRIELNAMSHEQACKKLDELYKQKTMIMNYL